MNKRFRNLKEQLASFEEEDLLSRKRLTERKGFLSRLNTRSPDWLRYFLLTCFLGSFLFYAGVRYLGSSTVFTNPVEQLSSWISQPDEEVLESMRAWMEEMGYANLTNEQLIELREEGVTATYTSRMRDLGYTDLTLDELVRLRQSGVSTTFAAMMKELGYILTVDDLIQLEQHNVTAYYTSNLHDLGYTDLSKEELIRLKDTGVRTSEVEQLLNERETRPDVEELIRYHISNQ